MYKNSILLNNIQNLIKITEDNIFVQAKNYGISGVVDNWLTKLFSPGVTDNFETLIDSIEHAANILQVVSIVPKDNEEVLNRAIHKCKEDDGKCIVNIFFDTINMMVMLLLDKYIELLHFSKVTNLEHISALEELVKLDLKDFPKLKAFDEAMYNVYANYVNSINQENFNKFFFKMRGSVINAPFIKEKLNVLDNYVTTLINNKNGKRMSISQK
jgi:hypothetical protein